jgi:hypothetical protein
MVQLVLEDTVTDCAGVPAAGMVMVFGLMVR